MRVTVSNNVISVITDIKLEAAKKNLVEPTLYDEKHNPIYQIQVDLSGKGQLSKFGLTANTVSDEGNLAVVIVDDMNMKEDDMKLKYGKAVIAAQKFCPMFANACAEAQEALDAAFAN